MTELAFFYTLVNGMCWQLWMDYWAVAALWFCLGGIVGEAHGWFCGRSHKRSKS
jgi:hypothetical protein